jgi:hypothetical protein
MYGSTTELEAFIFTHAKGLHVYMQAAKKLVSHSISWRLVLLFDEFYQQRLAGNTQLQIKVSVVHAFMIGQFSLCMHAWAAQLIAYL